jgi:hypothetical protein
MSVEAGKRRTHFSRDGVAMLEFFYLGHDSSY